MKVVLTDKSGEVSHLCKSNIELNRDTIERLSMDMDTNTANGGTGSARMDGSRDSDWVGGGKARYLDLNWGEEEEARAVLAACGGRVDYIIGSVSRRRITPYVSFLIRLPIPPIWRSKDLVPALG